MHLNTCVQQMAKQNTILSPVLKNFDALLGNGETIIHFLDPMSVMFLGFSRFSYGELRLDWL